MWKAHPRTYTDAEEEPGIRIYHVDTDLACDTNFGRMVDAQRVAEWFTKKGFDGRTHEEVFDSILLQFPTVEDAWNKALEECLQW